MPLPFALREAVERELSRLERPHVARAAEQITTDYKAGRFGGSLSSAEARAAYLITRLPATYAACAWAFAEVAHRLPEFAPTNVLDLGAGPGTASWAAAERWPSLREFTLVEANREFANLGQQLSEQSDVLKNASWTIADVQALPDLPIADVVVLSYAFGEFRDPLAVLHKAWAATKEVLVIIEPGTPRNFEPVLRARRELISAGAHMLSPCPHELECPMLLNADWCHFAVRLERTSEHRRMKGGALGYEDEKFSYLAFVKHAAYPAETRIVRHPRTHSGYIQLTLCTAEGLQQQTITRSQKEAFRAARRAKWGDEWRQLE